MTDIDQLPLTLIDLLANSLVLRQLTPYIPIRSLLALSATNKSIRGIIISQPEPWRHLDLSRVKRAISKSSPIDIGGVPWRAERMDESLTEDEFYAGPLRGIFIKLHQKQILRNVQTLILDGLSVPADLVREIVAEDKYNVKLLSLRGSNNLNQTKLQQVLRYITRPTRAEGTPKLKGLYFFAPKDSPRSAFSSYPQQYTLPESRGVMDSEGAQIGAEWNYRSSAALESIIYDDETRWYSSSGRVLKRPLSDWPETLQACKGLIAFDAVLCRGPRHDISKVDRDASLVAHVQKVQQSLVQARNPAFLSSAHRLLMHQPCAPRSIPSTAPRDSPSSSSAVKTAFVAGGVNAVTAGGVKTATRSPSPGSSEQNYSRLNFEKNCDKVDGRALQGERGEAIK